MKDEISESIRCSCCGTGLPQEWIRAKEKGACPNCGFNKMTILISIVENACLDIHEALNGKVKDKKFSSKKNQRYEFFDGDEVRKNDGKWMKKSRVIDKYKDEYKEKVTDPETGDVVHECEEPLSEHFNHGSAKFKK